MARAIARGVRCGVIMTISTSVNSQTFAAVSGTTPIAIGFPFAGPDDLRVTRINIDGSETLLVRNSDYSITGNGRALTGALVPISLTVGRTHRIERITALLQTYDPQAGVAGDASAMERQLDDIVMAQQDVRGDVDAMGVDGTRALRVPGSETVPALPSAAGRASKFLAFDGSGDPVMVAGTGASPETAALVPIADAGGYYTGGDVEAALQQAGAERVAPRPISTGGTGGTNVATALTNLGIANVGAEVAITGSLTIANSFPAAYVIRDAGSPADYNIFLPAAAAVGAIVYFRVDPAATKMFTLYDGGTSMDGEDRRILWAGETVMLHKTLSGWSKIGGQTIPIHGAIRRLSAQSLTTAGWQSVLFTSGSSNYKGLNLGFNAAGSNFIAPRDGVYMFTASFAVADISVGSETYGSFSDKTGAPCVISVQTRETGQSRNTHNISIIQKLVRGETYGCKVFANSGTPQLEYVGGVLEITMTYQEVITW
jgi:hypothetical protein